MADSNKDLVARLTDLSEGAIQRLSEAPGAERAVQALKSLADKVDDLQRRTRGVEELEKRMTALEKRVDAMAKPKTAQQAGVRCPCEAGLDGEESLIFDRDGAGCGSRREEQAADDIGGRVEARELEQHDDGREPDRERDP